MKCEDERTELLYFLQGSPPQRLSKHLDSIINVGYIHILLKKKTIEIKMDTQNG
jgi:hypothetical protein